jgi:hypothetical protein
VYRRADLSRTIVLVVALLLAAVPTGVLARGCCATDPDDGSHPNGVFHISSFGTEREQTGAVAAGPGRTNVALIGTTTPLLVWRHRRTERM